MLNNNNNLEIVAFEILTATREAMDAGDYTLAQELAMAAAERFEAATAHTPIGREASDEDRRTWGRCEAGEACAHASATTARSFDRISDFI